MKKLSALLLLAAGAAGCGGDNTPSNVAPPGAAASARTKVLEVGAELLQEKPPLDALNAYLDGFHFYSGRLEAQVEAHHYCSNLNEEVTQCVIYDGNGGDAKIMGVEYIVSERLFRELPEQEKPLWHSHVYEVRSGTLIAPGIPAVAEHELMEKLVATYGKTWHTWHTDRDKELPIGVPQLMMGFTADGQVHEALVGARDRRFGVDTSEIRERRADIAAPPIAPGADAWQHGQALQIADPTGIEAHHPDGAQSDRRTDR
jgi:hypothetical protein